MRPYIGSWKLLAAQGAAAVIFGIASARVAVHHAVGPRRTARRFRVRRRRHRALGRNRQPTARPPWVGRLLGRHQRRGRDRDLVLAVDHRVLALLAVIATWSLIIGGTRIVFAVSNRKQMSGTWSVALSGRLLLVLLGGLLIAFPGEGAIGITWAIGWLAMLFGTTELWLASVVRHETHHGTGSVGVPGFDPDPAYELTSRTSRPSARRTTPAAGPEGPAASAASGVVAAIACACLLSRRESGARRRGEFPCRGSAEAQPWDLGRDVAGEFGAGGHLHRSEDVPNFVPQVRSCGDEPALKCARECLARESGPVSVLRHQFQGFSPLWVVLGSGPAPVPAWT